jgi:N-acetylglutamate synthase-like GNAT family acetyltransferase
MDEFTIRPATARDFSGIRRLINKVQINPTGLDWRRFVIAVDAGGTMRGCGQLKPHGPGVVELASIAVEPDYQHRGLARAIIENLLSGAPRPLYLTCRSGLESFYSGWGFRSLGVDEMPAYYRRLVRWAATFFALTRREETLLVMRLE